VSFNAASLKLMADKGLSAHDIAEIAAANESSCDSAAERRRAWDRERKREQREAQRLSGGMSGGNPPDPSPNERDNLTPTREEKPKPNGLVKKTRRPIPDDWQPMPFAIGSESRKVVDGWPPGEFAAQLEQFKAHHRSKHNTFIDPQDAWSTWTLNTRKWGVGKNERRDKPSPIDQLVAASFSNGLGAGEDRQAGGSGVDGPGRTAGVARIGYRGSGGH
jgi:hypothetical protein